MPKRNRVFVLTERQLQWQDTLQLAIGIALGASFMYAWLRWEHFAYAVSWLVGWIL